MCTCHVYCVWVSQEKSWESGNLKMESEIFGSSNLRASHPVPVGISSGACRYLTRCLSVSHLVPVGIVPGACWYLTQSMWSICSHAVQGKHPEVSPLAEVICF